MSQLSPAASGPAPPPDDQSYMLQTAQIYYSLGLFPVPGLHVVHEEKDEKKPALQKWTHLIEMARRGERLPFADIVRLFQERPDANAIGHILLKGRWVLDSDGEEGKRALAALPSLPAGPLVGGKRGFHFYGRTEADLPTHARVGAEGALELLGPGRYVELPPSPGKRWLTPLEFPLPELPEELRPDRRSARAKAGTAKLQAGRFATTETDLAPWRELLPDLHGSGPWRCRCPFHPDEHESFSVFPGKEDGRLLWKCQAGCEGSGEKHSGTLEQLRCLLECQAALAVAQEDPDAEVRAVLVWAIRRAIHYVIDLSDPSPGIGITLRDIARETGCEEIVEYINPETGELATKLKQWGRGVYRVLDKLKAHGVEVAKGTRNLPGQKGRASRLFLATWLEQSLQARTDLHINRVLSVTVQPPGAVSVNVRPASVNVSPPPSPSPPPPPEKPAAGSAGRRRGLSRSGSGAMDLVRAVRADAALLERIHQTFPGSTPVR